MSAQIDVLAVLRGLCTRLDRVNLPGGDIPAQEAAALSVACCNTAYAVAELIERDRVATEIFTCILRGVNDLDGPMGHRSEQYVAGWLGQWAKSMHAAGFKPPNPESRDITSALARCGGAK